MSYTPTAVINGHPPKRKHKELLVDDIPHMNIRSQINERIEWIKNEMDYINRCVREERSTLQQSKWYMWAVVRLSVLRQITPTPDLDADSLLT